MASLYIKDSETAALAAEIAAATGTTKTEAVRQSLLRRKAELTARKAQDWLSWMEEYRKAHPLPPPTGLKADKAFFDEMWGEKLTLFVDASALVAIIADEDEAQALTLQTMADDDPIWSPMSCWETISALRSSHRYNLKRAREEVEAFAGARPLRLVPVGETERRIALDAYQEFGRGSGHPAKLNMGDCFAYACAKANNAGLLYKGNDFIHTDLA